MKFSIVIPVYNVAPYLTDCLESVRTAAQRVGCDVEIICVDDGSTDGSGEIADAFGAKDPAVRVLHQKNSGVSAARNRALELSTGDWLLFVDGDDFVRETWLGDVAAAIERNPSADLVGFGKMPYYGSESWGDGETAARDIGISAELDDRLAGFCVYQFAYSSRCFADLRFQPFAVGEDLVFVAEALARSRSCVVTDRREYGYRYRGDSASHVGMTPAKMRDVVAFNRAMFATLAHSGKRLGKAFVLGRGNEWFAALPRVIFAQRDDPAWNDVRSAWLDSMRDYAGYAFFPERQRRRAAAVAAARTPFAVWWHCLLPSWLQRKKII